MTPMMVTTETAPRDPAALISINRGVRLRLAIQGGLFSDEREEQAFLAMSDEDQANFLAHKLKNLDDSKGGTPASAPTAMPSVPMPPVVTTLVGGNGQHG